MRNKPNRLTFVREVEERDKNRSILCLFKCECGGAKLATLHDVDRNHVRSCGCIRAEVNREIAKRRRNADIVRIKFEDLPEDYRKVCSMCKEEKGKDAFYPQKRTPDGLEYLCAECKNAAKADCRAAKQAIKDYNLNRDNEVYQLIERGLEMKRREYHQQHMSRKREEVRERLRGTRLTMS